MKKITPILVFIILLESILLPEEARTQTPQKMSYQAVIRDASNQLVTDQNVGMQISILQGSTSGTSVYKETQTTTTNANGLVSIEIGTGTTNDDFSAIDWSAATYFIKTETDPKGGTNYTITGTSQLLSVPYALHAKTAETVTGGITETDPVFGAWDKSTGISITESQISDLHHFTTADETDPVFTAWDKDYNDLTNKPDANQWTTENNGISYQDGIVNVADISIKDSSEILFKDYGQIRSSDNNHRILFRRDENILEMREYGDIIFSSGSLDGTETNILNIKSDGNVGIGIEEPTAKLDVNGRINVNSNFISNVADPDSAQDAATKYYVDSLISSLNTSGDQDISGIAINTQAIKDTAAQIRADIPDVSGFLTSETDPVYTASEAANITASDITNLGNLSGVNTGDQDGSETKVTAGTNITVTGSGTTANPYVVNATGATTLTIGQNYQGGFIFWLDATGQHGLICAKQDQSTGVQWYNGTYKHTGTKGDGLYAGAMNTALIVAAQLGDNTLADFAAKICADYTITVDGITYGDWYLPSKYELHLLYLQKNVLGGFSSTYYWSSTENNANNAYRQSFSVNIQNGYDKISTFRVRAIRAF